MRVTKFLVALLLMLSLSACITPRSYVDPQYRKATFASVGKTEKPMAVRLNIVFQRNGQALPKAIKEVRPIAERVLQNSGAFVIVTDASAPELRFTLNNVADLKEAAKKGFATGLTFGGKGSTVTDFYEARIELVAGDGTVAREYKHALVSTLGNADAPIQGVAPVAPVVGFGMIVEDILLNFVQDLKADGKLAYGRGEFAPILARL